MKATVIADASFKQVGKKKFSGWATWVRIDGSDKAFKAYGTFKTDAFDSGAAEVLAALSGMWVAARLGATSLLVRSDCMLVTHLIRQNKQLKPKYKNLWTDAVALPIFAGLCKLEAKHVKGHEGWNTAPASWVNRWCDEHAKLARLRHEQGEQFVWTNL